MSVNYFKNLLHLFTVENIILFFVLLFIYYYIYTWFIYKEFFGKMGKISKKKQISTYQLPRKKQTSKPKPVKRPSVIKPKKNWNSKKIIKKPPMFKAIGIPKTVQPDNVINKNISNIDKSLGNTISKISESQNNINNLTNSLIATQNRINKLSQKKIFKVDMSSSTKLKNNMSVLDKNIASNASIYIKNINDKKNTLFTGI